MFLIVEVVFMLKLVISAEILCKYQYFQNQCCCFLRGLAIRLHTNAASDPWNQYFFEKNLSMWRC